jgi:hypothetical protein
MLFKALKKIVTAMLIAALHAPLLVYALMLYERLRPGQSVSELPWASIAVLMLFFALPYAVLAVSRTHWNPPRARLNEPTGS